MSVVDLLASAIAKQEGWFATEPNIPILRNNPGDVWYQGQWGGKEPEPGDPPSHIAIFQTPALGIAALYRQLWLQIAMGQTVERIVYAWAPPSANDSATYLKNVLEWTKLPADTPVLNFIVLDPPIQEFIIK